MKPLLWYFVFIFCVTHAVGAEVLVFDCKIEGHKTSDVSKELVVCGVRQKGEFIGTILLRSPTTSDPRWDTIISPVAIRAMQGDKVFFCLCCEVNPRIKPAEGHADVMNVDGVKVSEWDSLHVSEVREIPETEFLGNVSKK